MLILYLKQYSNARKLGILSGFSSILFAVKYDKGLINFKQFFHIVAEKMLYEQAMQQIHPESHPEI